MPFVNVRTVKGLLNDEERRQIQDRIFDVVFEIEGKKDPEFRKYIWVVVEEMDPAAWSIGGEQLTPETVAGLASR